MRESLKIESDENYRKHFNELQAKNYIIIIYYFNRMMGVENLQIFCSTARQINYLYCWHNLFLYLFFAFFDAISTIKKAIHVCVWYNLHRDYYYEPSVEIITSTKNNSSVANPELVKSKGKRVLVCSEPDDANPDAKFRANKLKSFRGNDLIQARGLYQDFLSSLFQIWDDDSNEQHSPNVKSRWCYSKHIENYTISLSVCSKPGVCSSKKRVLRLKMRYFSQKRVRLALNADGVLILRKIADFQL